MKEVPHVQLSDDVDFGIITQEKANKIASGLQGVEHEQPWNVPVDITKPGADEAIAKLGQEAIIIYENGGK